MDENANADDAAKNEAFAPIKMETVNSTFTPDLHNSMSLPTNSLPRYSTISQQLTNLLRSNHYAPAAPIFVMEQGTSQAAKNVSSSRTNPPSTKSKRTSNSATIGPTTSLIPSTGLHIEKQFLHSLIVSAPL
jgi:hypothetical protein